MLFKFLKMHLRINCFVINLHNIFIYNYEVKYRDILLIDLSLQISDLFSRDYKFSVFIKSLQLSII
jgi:hypothetical protein